MISFLNVNSILTTLFVVATVLVIVVVIFVLHMLFVGIILPEYITTLPPNTRLPPVAPGTYLGPLRINSVCGMNVN